VLSSGVGHGRKRFGGPAMPMPTHVAAAAMVVIERHRHGPEVLRESHLLTRP
jgi:hypothetical protein